jgi:hypothetical protein
LAAVAGLLRGANAAACSIACYAFHRDAQEDRPPMSNPKRNPGSDEPDEFTPGERGLLFGWEWARLTREGEKIDPLAVSAEDPQRIAASVRDQITAAMRERLDASEDPDAESAFWAGFRDGVRAYLAEIQTGGEN